MHSYVWLLLLRICLGDSSIVWHVVEIQSLSLLCARDQQPVSVKGQA